MASTAWAQRTPSATWPRPPRISAERTARGQLHTHRAVARQIAGRGQDQVTEPGEAGKRFGTAAQRHAQTRHFRQATGDQRRPRVQAKAEPIGDPRCDGQHILHRATHFHADDVVAGIDTHGAMMKRRHGPLAARSRRTGDSQRHRQALAPLRAQNWGPTAHRCCRVRPVQRRPPDAASVACPPRSPCRARPRWRAPCRRRAWPETIHASPPPAWRRRIARHLPARG